MPLIGHLFSTHKPKKSLYPRDARPAPKQDQPNISSGTLLALAGGGLVISGLVGLSLGGGRASKPSRAAGLAASGAALLAASVLTDSAMEHYRGNYRRKPMYVAPTAAAVTLAAALCGVVFSGFSRLRGLIFGGAILTGLVGTGFHFKNILSRPGGLSLNNLFYRAPFGAPGALVLAGAAGIGSIFAQRAAERGSLGESHQTAGTALAAITAGGLFGLTAEVGLLHFRGAFHNPLMYAPVVAVPMAGLAMAASAANPSPTRRRLARRMLTTTTALGMIGTGLHAYGVSRNNGGFANWSQNLFQGPPIAAPPSLAGIAMLGLSALDLLRKGDRSLITQFAGKVRSHE